MEEREDTARVISCENGVALVRIEKGAVCKSCSLSGVCGGNDKFLELKIPTELKLKKDDTVLVSIAPGLRIISSLIIFVFPIFMMILFYILARYAVSLSENFSILGSFLGLILSGGFIYFLDKKMAKKIDFTILGKVEE